MARSSIPLERGLLVEGRYRLLRPLGSGGSAWVWAARDESLGREVALKVLSGSTVQGGHERERLKREAELLAALDHPRITTVFDFAETVGQDGTGHPILVTELVDGESLAARLERGALRPEEALSVCAQVADALTAAHRAGVVHRDVKPGNVMLGPDGAKLLDFGISRRETDVELTGQVLIGTPACMAPEQWRGGTAEPASDVYALGCLLYWCMSGHGPYPDREITALGMSHLLADPPMLPFTGQDRAAVDEIYEACVRKDPADRPSSGEVAAVLAGRVGPRLPNRADHPADVRRPTRRALLAAYSMSAGAMLVFSLVLTLALAGGSPAGQPLLGTATATPPHSSAPGAKASSSSGVIGAGDVAPPSSGANPTQGTTNAKKDNAGHHRGHGNGDPSSSSS